MMKYRVLPRGGESISILGVGASSTGLQYFTFLGAGQL